MNASESKLSGHLAGPSAASKEWFNTNRFIEVLRDPWYQLITRLQDLISTTTYDYWGRLGYRTLHLPITTTSISSPMGRGSDSIPVEIEIGGNKTYLADSMQFMLEYACRFSGGGSFYVMPSFRGESEDKTHLSQFYHSEVELCGDLDSAMDAAESYLRELAHVIVTRLHGPLDVTGNGTKHLREFLARDIARVTFQDAWTILGDRPECVELREGIRSITRAGERELMRYHGGVVWVTKWEHLSVPFYQAFASSDKQWARNADLLFGPGEVVGLGERHETSADLLDALRLHGVAEAPYEWYIKLKNEYPMRTAGFGVGLERFLMWVVQHDDIRDFQILPRFNARPTTP